MFTVSLVAQVAVSSGQPVTWMKEENYIFRLSAFNQQLTSWLDAKGKADFDVLYFSC